MTSREKLWLVIGFIIFGMAHVWGASMLATSNSRQDAPVVFANTGD